MVTGKGSWRGLSGRLAGSVVKDLCYMHCCYVCMQSTVVRRMREHTGTQQCLTCNCTLVNARSSPPALPCRQEMRTLLSRDIQKLLDSDRRLFTTLHMLTSIERDAEC